LENLSSAAIAVSSVFCQTQFSFVQFLSYIGTPASHSLYLCVDVLVVFISLVMLIQQI